MTATCSCQLPLLDLAQVGERKAVRKLASILAFVFVLIATFAVNGARTWKVYGPDLDGIYGGQQGTGGAEAFIYETNGFTYGQINNRFGDTIGRDWEPWTGSSAYGIVAYQGYNLTLGGYGPQPGTGLYGDLIPQWRGHYVDWTGFSISMGARYYEPLSGRFLSPDPLGHAASMSLYDYCNGDPVNGLDPDGRCSNSSASNGSFSNYGTSSFSEQMNLQAGYGMDRRMQGNFDMPTLSEAIETGASMAFQATVGTAMNMAQSVATHFYQGMTGTDIKTGNSISGWSQLGNAAMFALDVAPMVGEVKLGGGAMEGVSNVGRAAESSAVRGIPRITESGLARVESHLDNVLADQFSDLPRLTALRFQAGERGMLERLRAGFTSSQDIEFYMHELKESARLRATGNLMDAHNAALEWRGVTSKDLFHPDVISANPAIFGNGW